MKDKGPSTKKLAGWIGTTSFAAKEGRGDHPGCVAMSFPSVKAYNDYFAEHSGLLVVEENFIPRWFRGPSVVAMVTNQLDPEEMEDMNEVSREVEFAMAKRRQAKQEAREKAASEAALVEQELKRLAVVGSKYEARVKAARESSNPKEAMAVINSGDPEILGDKGPMTDEYRKGHADGYKLAMETIDEQQ